MKSIVSSLPNYGKQSYSLPYVLTKIYFGSIIPKYGAIIAVEGFFFFFKLIITIL